eukprot:TRINITY_DN6506_c0_g1_i1.p1 TRINITY_DN6506_c0_g1~~TRINITY_DN6506_c0_g1_i1.p1  ORF type:complete len:310 (-),score=107.55 TRINITY_DN6506_c0_g1_i1:232-1161(-)
MATAKPPWSECNFENPFRALYQIGNTNSIPKIPDLLSNTPLMEDGTPIGVDFLKKCLTRDPDLRPDAQDLIRHPFVADIDYQSGDEAEGGEDDASDGEYEDSPREDALAAEERRRAEEERRKAEEERRQIEEERKKLEEERRRVEEDKRFFEEERRQIEEERRRASSFSMYNSPAMPPSLAIPSSPMAQLTLTSPAPISPFPADPGVSPASPFLASPTPGLGHNRSLSGAGLKHTPVSISPLAPGSAPRHMSSSSPSPGRPSPPAPAPAPAPANAEHVEKPANVEHSSPAPKPRGSNVAALAARFGNRS